MNNPLKTTQGMHRLPVREDTLTKFQETCDFLNIRDYRRRITVLPLLDALSRIDATDLEEILEERDLIEFLNL